MKRYKRESFLNCSYIKLFGINLQCTNVDLFKFEYSDIHNLKKQTDFQNAHNLK